MVHLLKKIALFKIVASIFFVSGLLLALCLLSYTPTDVSMLYATNEPTAFDNILGSFGSTSAAFLFYLFGSGAYFFILLFFFLAYLIFRPLRLATHVERIGACIVLVPTGATIARLYNFDGGRIGYLLAPLCLSLFNGLGYLIPFVVFAASSIVLLRFAGITIIHWCSESLARVTQRTNTFAQLYVLARKTVYGIWRIAYALYTMVHRLFDGSVIERSGQSPLLFEYDIEDEVLASQYDKRESVSTYTQPEEREKRRKPDIIAAERIVEKSIVSEQIPVTGQTAVRQPRHEKSSYQLPLQKDFFARVKSNKVLNERAVKEREQSSTLLQEKLKRFGIHGGVAAIKPGPVVTLFEYQPNIDTKLSRIIALEDDLALALQALSVRIIAPIPGTSVVGFEVANRERETVAIADVMQSQTYRSSTSLLPLILGVDTTGSHIVVDLAHMPHLLVAGSTGSGKSVALNAMLMSLLCKKTPQEMRLVLIDPKRIEFGVYADIAHLAFPVITQPKQAIAALKWVVSEMERRYELLARAGVRTIIDYQVKVGEMPFLVIVIDELSDLMMTAGREVEELITRVAQMARAAGIHMIVATQRPSVDVITGLIKVNFPSRISFRVTSKIDSRTILDISGAEKLLGSGDSLFLNARNAQVQRVHSSYVSDGEIAQVVNFIKSQEAVNYFDALLEQPMAFSQEEEDEALLQEVLEFVNTLDEVSISLLQRRFKIGYNRSARIIDLLQSKGVITPPEAGKIRKVIR